MTRSFSDRDIKMEDTKLFALKNAFFALLLEEINCQPGLRDELGANNFGAACGVVFGKALVKVISLIGESQTGIPSFFYTCAGSSVNYMLIPPTTSLFRDVADLLSIKSGSNYEALCRSALLHLYWKQYANAEKKLNIAKNNHDSRAFAHHVYGILRGLEGNIDGARFELNLARTRESHDSAIKRIDLALKILN